MEKADLQRTNSPVVDSSNRHLRSKEAVKTINNLGVSGHDPDGSNVADNLF